MDRVTLLWAAAVVALLAGLCFAGWLLVAAVVTAATGGGGVPWPGGWMGVKIAAGAVVAVTIAVVAFLVSRAIRATRRDWG
jgi:hypothetical protein